MTATCTRKRSHSAHMMESVSPTYSSHSPVEYDNSSPKSGKWSPEEEQFAQHLIHEFELGVLTDCEEGCTLRSYLAKKLNCAPMRISKKFAGQCIGKHVFTRKFNNTNEITEYPPNKYIKLTLPNESLPSITYDANLFRINSDSSESSLEYAETASNSTNEFDPIRDDSEAAEWRDVLSFFCGEFEQDDPDLMFNFQESWR